MNLSAKRRVELALPAALLRYVSMSCYQAGAEDGPYTDAQEAEHAWLMERLGKAACEPFDGLAPAEKAKLSRRVDRAVMEAFDEYLRHDAKILRVYMIVIMWMQWAMKTGALIPYPSAAFDEAAGALLDLLNSDEWEDLRANVGPSAVKQVPKFHARLMRLGYYTDATEAA